MKRWLVCLLLLLAGLPGGAADPEVRPSSLAPRKVTLVVCGLPRVSGIGYQMAIDKGFYRGRGLEVSLVYREVAINAREVERNGDFVVAPLLLALKWRISDGLPLVHLTQVVNRSTQVLVGWKPNGILRPESFDKRRIALPLGMQRLSAQVFFDQLKISPKTLDLSDRAGIELFVQKRVDGIQCSDYAGLPQLHLYGIDMKDLMVVSWCQDTSMDVPEDGLYCQKDLVNQNPAICQLMRAASQEGWRYVDAHPQEAAAVLLKNCQKAKEPMNQAQAELTIAAFRQAMGPVGKGSQRSGELSAAALQRALVFLTGQNLVPAETEIGIADFCWRK